MSAQQQQQRRPAPITCSKCRQLPQLWPSVKSFTIQHHETFAVLDESAANGCPLCRIMRQVLIFQADVGRLMNTSCPIMVQVSGKTNISVALDSSNSEREPRLMAYGLLDVVKSSSDGIPLSGGTTSKIHHFLPSQKYHELGELAKSSLQYWTSDCCKDSAVHQATENAILPTRVLDVSGGSEAVRLVDTEGQRGKYFILSYCWGKGNDRAKTTQKNLADRKKPFGINSLPATIRQAIEVTQLLGVQYVWIDAMCIVQAHSFSPPEDELIDWRREAPKMGQYYRNAALTIAATASLDSENGFICERASQKYPILPCLVGDWQTGLNRPREAIVMPAMPASNNQVHYGPLYTRGWTLQERVLSHHTLHWSAESVFWECEGYIKASECEPKLLTLDDPSIKDTRYVWSDALVQSIDDPLFAHFWPELVEEYCQMSLSFEGDRLIAIQGLVDSLERSTESKAKSDNKYVAGIFKFGFISGLAWMNTSPGGQKIKKVPSWSWASASAGNLSFVNLREKLATLVSVRDFDVVKGISALNGRLELRGPIWTIHSRQVKQGDDGLVAILDEATYPYKTYFHMDTTSSNAGSEFAHLNGDFTLLVLGWEKLWDEDDDDDDDADAPSNSPKSNRLIMGLILWPRDDGHDEFERVGAFEIREKPKSAVWEDRTKETVVIV